MKRKWNSIVIAAFFIATLCTATLSAQQQNDDRLLRVRETVWRAWFANDTKSLLKLVPPGTIVISAVCWNEWERRALTSGTRVSGEDCAPNRPRGEWRLP